MRKIEKQRERKRERERERERQLSNDGLLFMKGRFSCLVAWLHTGQQADYNSYVGSNFLRIFQPIIIMAFGHDVSFFIFFGRALGLFFLCLFSMVIVYLLSQITEHTNVQQQYYVILMVVCQEGSDWGLGQRSSGTVHGSVHGMVHGWWRVHKSVIPLLHVLSKGHYLRILESFKTASLFNYLSNKII